MFSGWSTLVSDHNSYRVPRLSIYMLSIQSVLHLEAATEKFSGDEACAIYLQAAIVYQKVD